MHKIAAILLSLMLTVAPVYGQSTPVAPVTPQSVIGEVSEAAQTLGTLNVVLLAVVGIMVVVVLIVLAVAYRGLSPLLSTIKSLNSAREDLQEQLFKRLEAGDRDRAMTADINQRTVAQLGKIETREQAVESRQLAVAEINTHTDEAVKPIDGKLQQVATTLEELKRDVVTKQVLDDAINPLVAKIDAALQVIHDLQQPDPVPGESPAPEHGTVGEVDAAETKEG